MVEQTHDSHGRGAHDPKLAETLSEAVEAELGSFIKLELAAEQMLEDETLLVSAYIKDDAARAHSYLVDLGSEIKLLESRTAQWLLDAADPTAIDWHRLARLMGHSEQILMAGEVADNESLRCLDCGAGTKVTGMVTLQPCQNCQSEVFQRQARAH